MKDLPAKSFCLKHYEKRHLPIVEIDLNFIKSISVCCSIMHLLCSKNAANHLS